MNELMRWSGEYVAIDEGGLALVEVNTPITDTRANDGQGTRYIEVGGIPIEEDESCPCGSGCVLGVCPDCGLEHGRIF